MIDFKFQIMIWIWGANQILIPKMTVTMIPADIRYCSVGRRSMVIHNLDLAKSKNATKEEKERNSI